MGNGIGMGSKVASLEFKMRLKCTQISPSSFFLPFLILLVHKFGVRVRGRWGKIEFIVWRFPLRVVFLCDVELRNLCYCLYANPRFEMKC